MQGKIKKRIFLQAFLVVWIAGMLAFLPKITVAEVPEVCRSQDLRVVCPCTFPNYCESKPNTCVCHVFS